MLGIKCLYRPCCVCVIYQLRSSLVETVGRRPIRFRFCNCGACCWHHQILSIGGVERRYIVVSESRSNGTGSKDWPNRERTVRFLPHALEVEREPADRGEAMETMRRSVQPCWGRLMGGHRHSSLSFLHLQTYYTLRLCCGTATSIHGMIVHYWSGNLVYLFVTG